MDTFASVPPMKVAIIGAGLVGSLSACYFGKRGHEVHLYEYRKDVRRDETVRGRSINLALSSRGRRALGRVGLEEALVSHHGIPMAARMIHSKDGTVAPVPYDPIHKQCIYSVGRMHLNRSLLDEAEKTYKVKTYFEHKLVNIDFDEGKLYFRRPDKNDLMEVKADLIVGADGAFSTVRRLMSRQPMFNFSQTYINHGYLELCIPPTPDNKFAMEANYLHIWPRGSFMLIALPNQDKSWTVTLFMDHGSFSELDSPEKLLSFFVDNFPDALRLIGEEKLVKDFFTFKPSHLISVKCSPFHVGKKVVIIGDAAHAMVPFYGQGMNAGFEDCYLLDELIHSSGLSLSEALEEFSQTRPPDAHAICDLAMYNYIEMRDLVTRTSFLLRKKLDTVLYKIIPKYWVPLYNSVTFSHMEYSKCVENKRLQDTMLKKTFMTTGALITIWILRKLNYFNFSLRA